MTSIPVQTLRNHSRYVPAYHFFAAAILIANFFWRLYYLTIDGSWNAVFDSLLSMALLVLFWYMRAFALTVQDRVIRLEERLRIGRLCSDLGALADELTLDQLVALRFASDEELPELARRVVAENITSRKEIKLLIQRWRPDHLRA